MKPNRRRQGDEGEDLACAFLEREGYAIVERNFRYERAEVDVIAKDGDELVFVEVKSRRSNAFGEPEDAVDEAKQEQIVNAAEGYLTEKDLDNAPVRFDVVAITYRDDSPVIEHIRDAF